MRLASFAANGRDSYGLISNDNGVIDLRNRLDQKTLLELLRAGALNSARAFESEKPDYSLDDVKLGIPVQGGEKIICVGINYPEREQEYKGELTRGRYPNLFVKFPSSFSAPGVPVRIMSPGTKVVKVLI